VEPRGVGALEGWRLQQIASPMRLRHNPRSHQGIARDPRPAWAGRTRPALRHDGGMTQTLTPPFSAPAEFDATLRAQGHAVLAPDALGSLAHVAAPDLDVMRASWNDLPPDTYLRDGGRYRRRRHS
jgi:hypothetical protein